MATSATFAKGLVCPECQNPLREVDGGLECHGCAWNDFGQSTTLFNGRKYTPQGEPLKVDKDGTVAFPDGTAPLTADERRGLMAMRRDAILDGNIPAIGHTAEQFVDYLAELEATTEDLHARAQRPTAEAVAEARARILADARKYEPRDRRAPEDAPQSPFEKQAVARTRAAATRKADADEQPLPPPPQAGAPERVTASGTVIEPPRFTP